MTSNSRIARSPSRAGTVAPNRRALLGGLAGTLLLSVSSRAVAAFEDRPDTFRPQELVDNGHRFFGSMSRGLAKLVEEATRRWGQPNGYILGQEASGAIVGGSATARARSTPATPGSAGSTGRVPRSDSMSAVTATAP